METTYQNAVQDYWKKVEEAEESFIKGNINSKQLSEVISKLNREFEDPGLIDKVVAFRDQANKFMEFLRSEESYESRALKALIHDINASKSEAAFRAAFRKFAIIQKSGQWDLETHKQLLREKLKEV